MTGRPELRKAAPGQGSTRLWQVQGTLRPCAPAAPPRSRGDRLLRGHTWGRPTPAAPPPSPRNRSPADSPRLPAHAAGHEKFCALGDDAQACQEDKGEGRQALLVPSEDRPYPLARGPAGTAIRVRPTKTGCAGAGCGRKQRRKEVAASPQRRPPAGGRATPAAPTVALAGIPRAVWMKRWSGTSARSALPETSE